MRLLALLAVAALGMALWISPSMAGPGVRIPDVTTTLLGDLNGDGHSEIAREKRLVGDHYTYMSVQIKTGSKVQLEVRNLCLDLNEGYVVTGKQIVVWRAEPGGRRYDPRYYNYTRYSWNQKDQRFTQVREGFTKKFYSTDVATLKVLRKLAANPGKELVLSRKSSFLEDARDQAVKKYGERAARSGLRQTVLLDTPAVARYYQIALNDPRLQEDPFVTLLRNGAWSVS